MKKLLILLALSGCGPNTNHGPTSSVPDALVTATIDPLAACSALLANYGDNFKLSTVATIETCTIGTDPLPTIAKNVAIYQTQNGFFYSATNQRILSANVAFPNCEYQIYSDGSTSVLAVTGGVPTQLNCQ